MRNDSNIELEHGTEIFVDIPGFVRQSCPPDKIHPLFVLEGTRPHMLCTYKVVEVIPRGDYSTARLQVVEFKPGFGGWSRLYDLGFRLTSHEVS